MMADLTNTSKAKEEVDNSNRNNRNEKSVG